MIEKGEKAHRDGFRWGFEWTDFIVPAFRLFKVGKIDMKEPR